MPEPKEESVDKENARKDKKSDLNKKSKKAKKRNIKNKEDNECSDEDFVLENPSSLKRLSTQKW